MSIGVPSSRERKREKERNGKRQREQDQASRGAHKPSGPRASILQWVFNPAGAPEGSNPAVGPPSPSRSAHPTAHPALHTVLAPVPRLSLQIAHGRVFHRAFPLFLLFLLDMRADKTEPRSTQRFLAVCCTLTLVSRAMVHLHGVHGLTNAWPRNGLPESLMMGACRGSGADW